VFGQVGLTAHGLKSRLVFAIEALLCPPYVAIHLEYSGLSRGRRETTAEHGECYSLRRPTAEIPRQPIQVSVSWQSSSGASLILW